MLYIQYSVECVTLGPQVCMAHAAKTGGLMELEELKRKVSKSRSRLRQSEQSQDISQDDVLRAIKKLKATHSLFCALSNATQEFFFSAFVKKLSNATKPKAFVTQNSRKFCQKVKFADKLFFY